MQQVSDNFAPGPSRRSLSGGASVTRPQADDFGVEKRQQILARERPLEPEALASRVRSFAFNRLRIIERREIRPSSRGPRALAELRSHGGPILTRRALHNACRRDNGSTAWPRNRGYPRPVRGWSARPLSDPSANRG